MQKNALFCGTRIYLLTYTIHKGDFPMTVIYFHEKPLNTIGSLPKIGTQAPDFTVTKTDLSEIHLRNYLGQVIVMNIFPSLDTETCASAMRRYNEISKKFPNVLILCISADLPFAQKRFCVAEKLDNVLPVSVFRHPTFGEDYGVTIIDPPLYGLLSRAVIILNRHGKIIYTEQVKNISNEPDYQAITSVLEKIEVANENHVR